MPFVVVFGPGFLLLGYKKYLHPQQLSGAFHIETSNLIYYANQVTGFCTKFNFGLKWVKKTAPCM